MNLIYVYCRVIDLNLLCLIIVFSSLFLLLLTIDFKSMQEQKLLLSQQLEEYFFRSSNTEKKHEPICAKSNKKQRKDIKIDTKISQYWKNRQFDSAPKSYYAYFAAPILFPPTIVTIFLDLFHAIQVKLCLLNLIPNMYNSY